MLLRDTVLEIPTYQRATSLVFSCVFFFAIKKFPAYVITVTYVKMSIIKVMNVYILNKPYWVVLRARNKQKSWLFYFKCECFTNKKY